MRHKFLICLFVAIIISGMSPLILHAQPSPLTVQPSTGNVGIGTNNPAYRFDVQGGTFFLGQRGDGCCAALLMGSGETHLYAFTSGRFGIHKYGGGSANAEVFSIMPDGKVGIGPNATAPSQALHVIDDAYKTTGGTT